MERPTSVQAGRRAHHLLGVIAVLALGSCADPGSTPSPAPPTVPLVPAPRVTGEFLDLVLTEQGDSFAVDLSAGIAGEVTEWSATSSDPNIVTVAVANGRLEIAPVRVGTVEVAVIARNAGGQVEATFTVRVISRPITPPTMAGELRPLVLDVGAGSILVDLGGAFSPPGFILTARSLDPGVVTASVSGTVVVLTVVAAGSTTLEIVAQNSAGSAARTLSVTVVPAPDTVGDLEPLELIAGAAPTVVDLSTVFRLSTGLFFEARSDDDEIATASVSGHELTVTPVAPGNTAVTITAINAAGSASRIIPVAVVAEGRTAAPTPVGTLPPLTLSVGGGSAVIDVSASFSPGGFSLEAQSLNPNVARVSVREDAILTVRPVGAGRASIELIARNAAGSAARYLEVEVAASLRPSGQIQPLSLSVGASPAVVDLQDAFSPPGFEVEARSLNERVATVSVAEGLSLVVTPVAAGSTSVVVTARNAHGMATQTIPVTVAAAFPRAVGTFGMVSFAAGGPGFRWDAQAHFTPAGLQIEARSGNPQVVTATMSGIFLTLTPVGEGSTSVVVTARNANGTATQTIPVTVAVAAPRADGTLAPVSLSVGGPAVAVDVEAGFTPAGLQFEARSTNPQVVTATMSGTFLTLRPVGEGSTSVVVTARNAHGTATQTIPVTVEAPAPRTDGTLPSVSLSVGGPAVALDVGAGFTPAGLQIEARSGNPRVVTATMSGTFVTLTPAGEGSTSVVVTARNASGSATQTISVTVAARFPRAVGTFAPVSLSAGGLAIAVDARAGFTLGGLQFEARSGNPQVVTATVNGPLVTLTPVAAGSTSVVVTARNANGSATQTISVTVAAAPPRAVGTFPRVSLSAGGPAVAVDARAGFTPGGLQFEARSGNPQVVTATVNGPLVTLTPVAAGSTSVVVTARNANGSATQTISVTVEAAAPRADGTLVPVSLSVGGPAVAVDVEAGFTPAGLQFEARSTNPQVVTATMSGTLVTLTPAGEGRTSVVVTARNASGSATQTISVTVNPPAPEAVGTLAPVSLSVGGATVEMVVFSAFNGWLTMEAESEDGAIVTAGIVDRYVVTFTPVGEGDTSVVVTARNESGSASHIVSVNVVAEAPQAVVRLGVGHVQLDGSYVLLSTSRYFTPAALMIEARSNDTGVVTAEVTRDGYERTPVVKIIPVGLGTTTVEITGTNANGSAMHTLSLTVVAPP